MNFLYKIYSGYDGFQPKRIVGRFVDRRYLLLGWKRYLDEVEVGDEVWIYFHGPHDFKPGVYVKGRVATIDRDAEKVRLRVFNYNTSSPLTDAKSSARIAAIVSARGRQVFLFPGDWETVSECTIFSNADSCSKRRCEWCPTWRKLRRIRNSEIRRPPRLGNQISAFIPAYWAIPPRCYLASADIRPQIHQLTHIIKAFKTGNNKLTYPLARAIFEAVQAWGQEPDFDCVVPIPLSPDKAAKGEIHRTRLLAQELAELFGIQMKQLFRLSKNVSKRRMLSKGYSYSQFEQAYSNALEVDDVESITHVLLVDDVCTYGGTLQVATRHLLAKKPDLQITAAVAVQMIVKSMVIDKSTICIQ
jgi:predicted amidophosphoribosyltransferase